jgi:TfoX/Sxy family transcriptional regulator of competence genes
MAYDEDLAVRVRSALEHEEGVAERRMFGALTFLVGGNMACGVTGDSLMVRLPPQEWEAALSEPGTRPMDMAGRPMRGWVLVEPAAVGEGDSLTRWVARGSAFARSLPPR